MEEVRQKESEKMKRNSSLQILQAAAAAAAAADGMAFDRPKNENDVAELYPLKTMKSDSHDSTKDQNSNSCCTATCDIHNFGCSRKMGIMERNDSTASLTTVMTAMEDDPYKDIFDAQQRLPKNGNEVAELQPVQMTKSDDESTKDNNKYNSTICYGCTNCGLRPRNIMVRNDLSDSFCNIFCENHKFWKCLKGIYDCK